MAYYENYLKEKKQFDEEIGNYTLYVNELETYVTSPDGGELWMMGTQHEITWTNSTSDYVDIQLFGEVYYDEIIMTVANTGSYYWNIPTDIPSGATYRIVVIDSDNQEIYDVSDYYFCLSENTYENVIGEWNFYWYGKQDQQIMTFYSNNTLEYTEGDGSYSGDWERTGNGIRFDIDYYNFYGIGIIEGDMMNGTLYDGGDIGYWYGYRNTVK